MFPAVQWVRPIGTRTQQTAEEPHQKPRDVQRIFGFLEASVSFVRSNRFMTQ